MNGWIGKLLRIDLSTQRIAVEDLDPKTAKDYIGGRGLGARILCDEIDPNVDPLGSGNKLLFVTGPLTGTNAPCGGRYMVVTKSPLTGGIASSNSGGFFPAHLKFTGHDLIIFEGKSDRPAFVKIEDDEVSIHSAEKLWGKNTHETEDILQDVLGDEFKIASVGQAGENLVRLACIMNDKHRAAGRSGVGAVMGAKNLKAVAVRGTKRPKIANEDAFKEAVQQARAMIKVSPTTSSGLPSFGTAVLVNVINENGLFPTRNFREARMDTADKISGETMADTILTKKRACYMCPIGCGRVTKVTDPEFAGEGEGPEYETVWALGAACGIDNLAAVAKANYICNEMGMDPISLGATIACAMELSEEGCLSEESVGFNLRFGDAKALVKLTEMTAKREGIGNDLAEGGARLAQKYGRPDLFMGVKKQEFPAYDGRGAQGMGLTYATSNRGACHVRGYTISPEILGSPTKLDPFTTEGKAEVVKAFQDLTAVVDSAGICLFLTFAFGADEILPQLEAATGAGYDMDSMMQVGERIWNLERMFNLQAGFTKDDDTLPKRILQEPIPAGPAKGQVARLHEMLPEYYKLRGWDDDGQPTSEKLMELGIQATG